jgi:hypothetical protein
MRLARQFARQFQMPEVLMDTAGKRPGLLAAGAFFLIVGLIVFVTMLVPRSAGPDTDMGVSGVAGQTNDRSRIWGVVGGLSAAAGLGLIGIGMNRWTRN